MLSSPFGKYHKIHLAGPSSDSEDDTVTETFAGAFTPLVMHVSAGASGKRMKVLVTEAFTVLREWLKPKLHKSKIPVDAPRIFPCNALKYVILLHALV
jgi:hypothetical protein